MEEGPTNDTYEDVEELENEIAELFENKNSEPKKVLELIIQNAPRRIERELSTTKASHNTWITCFRTDLSQIETFLQIRELEENIDPQFADKIRKNLAPLFEETNKYQLNKEEPPKEKLLEGLQHILD